MNRAVKRLLSLVLVALFAGNLVAPNIALALSPEALKSILNNAPFYGTDGGDSGSACSDSPTNAGLSGSDNRQKAYNYFFAKLNSDVQAAGIVGNLMQESGVNPKSDQAGGPGRGIAQWSDPGRWTTLVQFAGDQDPTLLGTQLNFLWAELNGTPPAGDYKATLSALKATTTVEDATIAFEEGYERAGTPVMEKRIAFAQQVLSQYGGNVAGGSEAVSGTTASCASTASVDCANITTSTSSLSQSRQNVVCLAQAELGKWTSGEITAGTDFMKLYSQGRDEEWCADFVSYIYKQAEYPLATANNGNVPAVDSIIDIGEAGDKFTYHPANGYTPVAGDIVIYKLGWSHVNIVIAVNQNKNTMDVIGGNQSGSGPNTTSRVTQYTVTGYNTSAATHVLGYVSPNN